MCHFRWPSRAQPLSARPSSVRLRRRFESRPIHLPDRPTRPKRATRPARGHSSSVCPPFTTDLAAPVNPSAAPRPRPPAGPVDLRVGERRIRCPPLAAALSPQPPPPEQSSPTVQNQRALKRPCPSGRSTAPPRQVSRHQGSFGGLGSVVLGLVVAQPSGTVKMQVQATRGASN